MPGPIISSFIGHISQELEITIWDGEVPRQNAEGVNIIPENFAEAVFPIVKCSMPQSGFNTEFTFEDPYTDEGPLFIEVWGTTRASVEGLVEDIFELLSKNWNQIMDEPYEVYKCLLGRWGVWQEEGARTKNSELIYRGELHYDIGVHGVVQTRT